MSRCTLRPTLEKIDSTSGSRHKQLRHKRSVSGQCSDTHAALFDGPSSVTFDFQRNVAGIVSIDVASASSDAFLGVTFSESSLYVSEQACDGTADAGFDSPIWFSCADGPGLYTAAKRHNRGGFRYMTLVSSTTAKVFLDRAPLPSHVTKF